MNSDVPFGAWLKQQRRALDRSREQLAGQVGCSISLLEKIETGERRPSRQIAARIALCLAIPAEQRDAFCAAARAGRAPQDVGQVPTRTAPTTAVPPRTSHLPAPMTSFIGREWEIATVAARLRTPDVRLVTLTGAGGVGKTRLALQIASALHDAFPNCLWFVDLAPISDPALVISTIAQTLGVREQPGMSPAETLRTALREQELLLLLDNFEQVVVAAPELAQLLAGVPGLKLLVTSREGLRLSGEHIVVVAPLAVPDPTVALAAEQLAEYAAAQLFVTRAQAASDHFRLTDTNAPAVAAICARLDGLPLAIELAAARVPLFLPAALLARLEQRLPMLTRGPRDLPARQQTLRSTINWSYDLLTAAEQAFLRRLGVFVGGCTLEAAEGVLRSEGRGLSADALDLAFNPRPSVLDGLAALLSKSLLRQMTGPDGDPRFVMLETIREYAVERLEASGEADALRRRHASYFGNIALRYASQREWLRWLTLESDNLRAALAWSQSAAGDPALALDLAEAVAAIDFYVRGDYQGTHRRLAQALEYAHELSDTQTYARVSVLQGGVIGQMGELAAGRALFEQAYTVYQKLGDQPGATRALELLGWVAREQGDAANARVWLEQSVALRRELGDEQLLLAALTLLAEVAVLQEDAAHAEALIEESLILSRKYNDQLHMGWNLNHLGHAAQLRGDYDRAAQLHAESLTVFVDLMGEKNFGVTWAYQSLGETALGQGDLIAARGWLAADLRLCREMGDRTTSAWCLAGLGSAAAFDEEPKRAARLWGAAERLRAALSCRSAPAARATYERAVALARAQLGDEAFAAAWAAGEALSLEQAIAEALNLT